MVLVSPELIRDMEVATREPVPFFQGRKVGGAGADARLSDELEDTRLLDAGRLESLKCTLGVMRAEDDPGRVAALQPEVVVAIPPLVRLEEL